MFLTNDISTMRAKNGTFNDMKYREISSRFLKLLQMLIKTTVVAEHATSMY